MPLQKRNLFEWDKSLVLYTSKTVAILVNTRVLKLIIQTNV